MKYGCNSFDGALPVSKPLSIWLDDNIWEYINETGIPYSPIYARGYTRTGCMFCMFGVHAEESPNRFERMKITHPSQYRYCIEKLGLGEVLDYIGVTY
jgi:3'-phosphoadenosine 5'-phosphosulfate sulfotransferase (PAPS reductase)/FAD synthetase